MVLIITQILGGNLGKSNVGFLQEQRSATQCLRHRTPHPQKAIALGVPIPSSDNFKV